MFSIPLPNNIDKQELKSSYLSFLVRWFIIQWQSVFSVKITKQMFCESMKKLWWDKKRINRTWNNWEEWVFIKKITPDYLILQWKEKVSENWFIVKIDCDQDIWFYKYCKIITEIYALRPVKQDDDFKYKFKLKKNKLYNAEITKRSLEVKKWRWQRRLSKNVWCSLKTVWNRLKKSNKVHTIKRYDEAFWFRVNKTNLYFNLENITFIKYQNKNNPTQKRKLTLKSVHSSLLWIKALFLNNSISLNKSNNIIYNYTNLINLS